MAIITAASLGLPSAAETMQPAIRGVAQAASDYNAAQRQREFQNAQRQTAMDLQEMRDESESRRRFEQGLEESKKTEQMRKAFGGVVDQYENAVKSRDAAMQRYEEARSSWIMNRAVDLAIEAEPEKFGKIRQPNAFAGKGADVLQSLQAEIQKSYLPQAAAEGANFDSTPLGASLLSGVQLATSWAAGFAKNILGTIDKDPSLAPQVAKIFAGEPPPDKEVGGGIDKDLIDAAAESAPERKAGAQNSGLPWWIPANPAKDIGRPALYSTDVNATYGWPFPSVQPDRTPAIGFGAPVTSAAPAEPLIPSVPPALPETGSSMQPVIDQIPFRAGPVAQPQQLQPEQQRIVYPFGYQYGAGIPAWMSPQPSGFGANLPWPAWMR